MATYGNVTFSELVEGRLFRPGWERANNASVRNIPYGNKDNVQFAGQGNPTLTMDILLTADADMTALLALVGSAANTLSDLFAVGNPAIGNVYLVDLSGLRRYADVERWIATVTFMQIGS